MSNLTGLNTQAVQQVFNCFKNNLAVSNKKHKLKLEPSFKKSLTKVFQFLASEERALRAVSEQQKFEECLALTDSARQLHYALRTKPN